MRDFVAPIRWSWWWAALEDRLLWFVCLARVRFVAAVGTMRALRVCCFSYLVRTEWFVMSVFNAAMLAAMVLRCDSLRVIHSRLLAAP